MRSLHYVLLGLAIASAPRAKTLMVLGDWYGPDVDTIVRVDSLYVPRYDTASGIGYFVGQRNQLLVRTSALVASVPVHEGYRNDTLPDSLKVPTSIQRWWFSLPEFVPGLYARGVLQMRLSFAGQMHHPLLDAPSPSVAVDPYPSGNGDATGLFGELHMSFLDSCLLRSTTDTTWLWSGTRTAKQLQTYVSPTSLGCEDHDPFLSPRGKVRLLLPRPGARVWLLDGTSEHRMASDSGIWARYDLFALPGSVASREVRFRVESSSGEILEIDSAGSPFHLDDTNSTHWIVPALDGRPARRSTRHPVDSVVLAWDSPWDHQVPLAALTGGFRFAGAWKMGKGYRLALPLRPSSAFVASGEGNDSTAPVALPAPGKSSPDTVWIWNGPVFAAKDSFQLAGQAFDYALASAPGPGVYFPFSQALTSQVEGLVAPRLGSDGLPRWTGLSICGYEETAAKTYASECFDSANSPSQWFRSHPGTNAEFPIDFTLFPGGDGVATRSELLFFPLDTFRTLPDGTPNKFNSAVANNSNGHNFGYCLILRAEAELTDSAALTIGADDDTWVFVDSQLVVDLGGIHGMETRSATLASLGSPRPPVVPLDIFHCERHEVSSGLSVQSNFPVRPLGWTRTAPRRLTSLPTAAKSSGPALVPHAGRMDISVSAGVPWSLVLRSADGRIVASWSGSGPASVPWNRSGLVFADLRTRDALLHERVLGLR